MKIAIPSKNNFVEDHFGQCENYTVLTIGNNNKIESTEIVPSPQGCGCKSNIAAVLQQKNVSIMLAGNMGAGALNVLNSYGIKVYRGCSGDVNELAESFLKGYIEDSGIGCNHHENHSDGHSCNH